MSNKTRYNTEENQTNLKDPYSIDLRDGCPYFTEKNIHLVESMIRYNPTYSAVLDEKHPDYNNNYVGILKSENTKFFNFETLEMVIKSIDKHDSTHLNSEGILPKGSEHKGVLKTVNRIKKINNLQERLMSGDTKLVYEIASAVDTKYNFSFASKFCAYVCEFALDKKDGYCIYDDVVQAILPLYIYRYVDEETARKYSKIVNKNSSEHRRVESTISNLKTKDNIEGYKEYRDIIDKVINGIEKIDGIKITYSQFDHMLWYYFKGPKQRIKVALNRLLF